MRFLIFSLLLISAQLHAQDLFTEEGRASYYSDKFQGKATASGEKYNNKKFTAAHRTLPFGTIVKVTNLENDQTVEVVINDRGPFVAGRVLDVSKIAAEELGFVRAGIVKIKLEVVEVHDPKDDQYQSDRPERPDVMLAENTFFEVEVKESSPEGFGVQIASFEEQANVLALIGELKHKYKKEVTLQVTKISGVKTYKVIIGKFHKREDADEMALELKAEYPGAFIFNFEGR